MSHAKAEFSVITSKVVISVCCLVCGLLVFHCLGGEGWLDTLMTHADKPLILSIGHHSTISARIGPESESKWGKRDLLDPMPIHADRCSQVWIPFFKKRRRIVWFSGCPILPSHFLLTFVFCGGKKMTDWGRISPLLSFRQKPSSYVSLNMQGWGKEKAEETQTKGLL